MHLFSRSLTCTLFLRLAVIDCIAGIDPSAFQTVPAGPENHRAPRETSCETTEYLHNTVCCQWCPAGTRVVRHCQTHGGKSSCAPCLRGDYTIANNGVERCLTCKRCRGDQETVHNCTSTSDTVCQCKFGRFCLPNEPCEFCVRCTERCPDDLVIVHQCNATSDAVCGKETAQTGGSFDGTTAAISPHMDLTSPTVANGIYMIFPILISILILILIPAGVYLYCQRRPRKKPSFSNTNHSEENESTGASVQSLGAPLLTEEPVAVITVKEPKGLLVTTTNSNLRPPRLQSSHYTPVCQSDVTPSHKPSSATECAINLEANNVQEESSSNVENQEDPADTTIIPSQNEHPTGELAEQSLNGISCPEVGLSPENTYTVFRTFEDKVPVKEWKSFMRNLHLDENDIDAAIYDNPNNVREQHHAMLVKWKHKFGKEATINKLLLGLREINLKACYENIENELIQMGILNRICNNDSNLNFN